MLVDSTGLCRQVEVGISVGKVAGILFVLGIGKARRFWIGFCFRVGTGDHSAYDTPLSLNNVARFESSLYTSSQNHVQLRMLSEWKP